MARRILVVDDEVQLVEMLKMRLEAEGYEVSTASDGEEALGKAKDLKPDLIVLDIMMPKMDGFEVLRRLRADLETQHTPVVMLTAKGDTETMFKTHDLGSTDYFIKPFDTKELLDFIKRYV